VPVVHRVEGAAEDADRLRTRVRYSTSRRMSPSTPLR
jgi:hypothetical protein